MIKQFVKHIAKGLSLVLLLTLIQVPGAQAQVETGENIVDSATQFGQIQYFRTLLEETGLDDELSQDGPFTVFAPTDQAFQEIENEELQNLLENPDELRNVLRAHIVNGSMVAEDLAATDNISTLEGSDFEVTHHEQGISVDEALLVAADIIATNGVIHAVNTVLMP